MIMERKRMDCPALPPGWKKEEVIRKSGLSAGKSDVYYYSPTGKKFRSKPQLSRYLGNAVDLGCFDFRTGKMMPSKLQKNKQRLRNENFNLFKLFWEKRLKGLRSSDVTEEVLRTMELPKGLQSVGPATTDETLLSAIASALHMSSTPITGQTSAAAEKNPAVWLNTSQPLCKAFVVTDEDIREQELKVHRARKSLEEALMVDGLARAAESTRDTDI
ncbi:methyl-CpG-binding domain protein 2 isoform X2 [Paramormyrops kingsleyae]|uniref:methyl-CpG-binding domain protein 2 isoform X2 n=1 Tax=Paramormyrops kingsleyae TaxID=1676925 RepID=UPI000CD6158C|nr:methyl-CpG-binding domain protein 2-like isoform X2 [Paramormyrops kingsleyae]